MTAHVFRNNTVFVNEVFANERRLFGVFSHALVQVPKSTAYITCIAQITLKFNKLTAVFYASVLLLIMNFVITLSK